MEVILAKKHGFCFGVRRAIKIAEKNEGAHTLGPLIHNYQEINRLKRDFGVGLHEDFKEAIKNQKDGSTLIIRTHGIPKNDLEHLQQKDFNLVDATCPFVTKPQQIAQEMSEQCYKIVIFGDIEHPEIKGVMSYASNQAIVISSASELESIKLPRKVALISQTTKQIQAFSQVATFLIAKCQEVRIFNTICNATFDNQNAARELSKKVDIMIVVGGKTSSNTKQLLHIAQQNCKNSYLVEDESEVQKKWFSGKKTCGITAGASTPDWIVQKVREYIEGI